MYCKNKQVAWWEKQSKTKQAKELKKYDKENVLWLSRHILFGLNIVYLLIHTFSFFFCNKVSTHSFIEIIFASQFQLHCPFHCFFILSLRSLEEETKLSYQTASISNKNHFDFLSSESTSSDTSSSTTQRERESKQEECISSTSELIWRPHSHRSYLSRPTYVHFCPTHVLTVR